MNRIVLLLLVVMLASCGDGELAKDGKETDIKSQHAVRSVKITTVKSELRNVEVIEQALGRILDPATTTIAAEVPARVRKVKVDVGDKVAKGDVLAQLDTSDMQVAVSTAAANLARNKAQANAQERLVQRYRKLAEDKFISTTMLDQAEAQLIALQKSVKAAKAQLRQAKNNLARTDIVAPVTGTIQKRWVAAGDYIGVGKPMFQLVTNDQFIISITVPETKIHSVKVGIPVRMHLPGSDQIISASINDLTPMIGSSSNAFEARVRINNPGNWRPGGSVIAELIIATHKQAVVVPEECVVLRPAGEVVYVLKGEKVEVHSIQTGVRRNGYVEITDGLSAGVTLAATGAAFLSDGASVQVQAGAK
ncbi:efflux RND transporter periplasmic adaptor subunit [Ghiorsea bivora]|uniref:efflux RND transporter periplasmic adaptor subunit n=1 Tax=Ghiorsea bivora TaxID=1485545 RepID=UPI00056F0393|nr:efflux RND transporter periplasmic adaptor subunit [Ghiorsea bivora]